MLDELFSRYKDEGKHRSTYAREEGGRVAACYVIQDLSYERDGGGDAY